MTSVRLRYRKAAFVPNLLLLSIALAFLNAFLALTLTSDWATVAVMVAASIVLLLTLGISPFLASHRVDDEALHLRQGWYFRADIPLGDIASVQVVERGPWRTGVFFELAGDALYVTTQRHDLLLLVLKEQRRFGFAWGKRAGRVYFDTMDRDLALRRLADKALTPSSPGRWS